MLHWPPNRELQIDSLLRGLGFYLFPVSGLLPLAIAAVFGRLPTPAAEADAASDPEPGSASQEVFARVAAILPVAWFGVTYVLTTLHCALVGDLSFPAVPALALVVGFYLGRLWDEPESGSLAAGACAALSVVMVGHDFFFAPEHYLSGHLSEVLRWPVPLAPVGQVLTGGAVLIGGAFGLCLLVRPAWRRQMLLLSVGTLLLAAGLGAHALSPALARHVSYRGLYTRYKNLGGGELALYGVQQSSGRIYGQNSTQLQMLPDVMQFLSSRPTRAFVIINATELGAVDREARLRGQRYFVVDDSNSQFLLLTNRLLPNETDLNPLRRFVSDIEPHPQVSILATFDEKIELLGYDMPNEVSRGEELVIRLYYRVLAPIPASYRVFLHFDGMGTRWNGDHPPLQGQFTTNYWSPGTYVTDEHKIPISRLNQPTGFYQVLTGFWPGGDGARLRVSAGNHESDQRVRLGVLRVK
jgi:hypothetical protein